MTTSKTTKLKQRLEALQAEERELPGRIKRIALDGDPEELATLGVSRRDILAIATWRAEIELFKAQFAEEEDQIQAAEQRGRDLKPSTEAIQTKAREARYAYDRDYAPWRPGASEVEQEVVRLEAEAEAASTAWGACSEEARSRRARQARIGEQIANRYAQLEVAAGRLVGVDTVQAQNLKAYSG